MAQQPLDLQGLVDALAAERRTQRISWREIGRQSGVSPSTLTRMQQGRRPDVDTFAALLGWLGTPAERFLRTHAPTSEEPNPAATFAALMRTNRVKELTPRERAALDAIVDAALVILKKPDTDSRE